MQFVIRVQDVAKRYRYKNLMLSVPKAVDKRNLFSVDLAGMPAYENNCGPDTFDRWIENLKVAQRPYWTGDEARTCFICETEFGFFER